MIGQSTIAPDRSDREEKMPRRPSYCKGPYSLGLLLFFIIIICLNIYDWWKLRNGLLLHKPGAALALLLVMLFLTLLPVIMRLAVRGHGNGPRALELIAWLWLAWSFWLAAAFLFTDLWDFALLTWRLWLHPGAGDTNTHNIMRYCFSPRSAACFALGFVAFASIWGSIEARLIRIREINIVSAKVPPTADGFKLLQLSDVHIGPSLDNYMLKRIIRLARAAQPDLLVSTGDLIDGCGVREHRLAVALAAAADGAKGSYAVLGNHEAYNGLEESIRLHREANMTLLRQQGVSIDGWLWLYGVDDPAVYRRNGLQSSDLYAGLSEAPTQPEPFKVLLKHQPQPDKQALPFFDLQLSGHSHGGQIVPFNFVVNLAHRWRPGRLHQFAEGMKFYVSRGTGVWGPPLRFLAPPELTLFVFQCPETNTDSGADLSGQKSTNDSKQAGEGI